MKRKLIGGLLVGIIPLFLLVVYGLFFDFDYGIFEYIIYFLFSIFLLLLFIIKIKNIYKRKKNKTLENYKLLIYLIPLFFLIYLGYSHFIDSQEYIYFYDIGTKEDLENPLLSTQGRTSEPILDNELNYRKLEFPLIYFDVPLPRKVNDIKVEIRFKDNFTTDYPFKLGVRDEDEWHYRYWEELLIQNEVGNWTILQGTFYFNGIKVKNNKINFLIDTPNINNSNEEGNIVYVDWIKITFHRKGLFGG